MLRLEQDRQALNDKLADMDRDSETFFMQLRNQAEIRDADRDRFAFRVFLATSILIVIMGLVVIVAVLSKVAA